MPNVIKSRHVLIKDEDVKIIDSNAKDEFAPINFKEAVEIDSDTEEDNNSEELYQMNHEENASIHLNNMKSYAEKLIEDAKKDAETIKMNAMLDAKHEIDVTIKRSEEEGYKQGIQKAEAEIQNKQRALLEKEEAIIKEYDEKLKEHQQIMADIIISLIQKITGILIEERSIIVYLVTQAVKEQSSCNEFRIILSKSDFPEVEAHLDELKELVRSTAVITLVENPEFEKNQCKIETDKNIIDCSIETKLSNLIMALKLL